MLLHAKELFQQSGQRLGRIHHHHLHTLASLPGAENAGLFSVGEHVSCSSHPMSETGRRFMTRPS